MKYWLPIVLFLLIAPFTPAIDLALSTHFAPFANTPLYEYTYKYAAWPALVVGCVGGLLFLFSERYKFLGLYLALVLVIGNGAIVHGLKEVWGRPRPKQIEQFGGTATYRPMWMPDFHHKTPAKSFPSGHCSMGFYFFAVILAGRRWPSRRLELAGWFALITLGSLLSLTRIAQGGHYFSDVLAAALIMWLISCLFLPIATWRR